MFKESVLIMKDLGPEKVLGSGEGVDQSVEMSDSEKKQFQEHVYNLFESNTIGDSVFVVKLIQKVMDDASQRLSSGEQLTVVDGIRWTWADKDGNERSEIIPFVLENKKRLSSFSLDEVKEHLSKEDEEKRALAEGVHLKKRIDSASKAIVMIYEKVLEGHDIDKVLALNHEEIDKYLMDGYTKVFPLFDGVGRDVLGYVMKNPKTGDREVFELILNVEEDEEAEENHEETLEEWEEKRRLSKVKSPEEVARKEESEQLSDALKEYFPNELNYVDDFSMEAIELMMEGEEVSLSDYNAIIDEQASLRGYMLSMYPELEKLGTSVIDELSEMQTLCESGVSHEEKKAYIEQSGIHGELANMKDHLSDDMQEKAAYHLYKRSVIAEIILSSGIDVNDSE